MENTIVELFQLNENSDINVPAARNKSSYVSFIKINGKPILPPLVSEEKRNELQKFKQKAVEIELKLMKQKAKTLNQIPSETSSIETLPPSRQSTPARPISLNLKDKFLGKAKMLCNSVTDSLWNQNPNIENSTYANGEILSSHKISRKIENAFTSTLEHRLALDENVPHNNNKNFDNEHSISMEDELSENYVDSEGDNCEKKIDRWSPLKIEPLNTLKVELVNKESQDTDDNLEVSLDDSQNTLTTPETVTQSPNLMRQSSYTLLTPSPALLSFLESQKNQTAQVSPSLKKKWDSSKMQKNWKNGELTKSLNGDVSSDEQNFQYCNKKYSCSLDNFHAANTRERGRDYSDDNSEVNGSGSSPGSYDPRKNISKLPRMKTKAKKSRSVKRVPSPESAEKVPSTKDKIVSTQDTSDFLSLDAPNELSQLSDLLYKMKMDHERQKKELEDKQQLEIKRLETIFRRKEAELLGSVHKLPRKSRKSIYSQSSKDSEDKESDLRMMGDGRHNRDVCEKAAYLGESCTNPGLQAKRPHSAKDIHQLYENDCNRRTRSMDFGQRNQDTDLDVSFDEDFLINSRDAITNNEYGIESDSLSYFSSRSSTLSSDGRLEIFPNLALKKFQGISSEEFAKYNQAAAIITAAARGFLTRRLLRTAHVQSLITTLRDAITCATQLHGASDIADSDIDLMRRLGRQIEAAWDAVYSVFFNTDTSSRLQLIAADRERLRVATAKMQAPGDKKKRISSATRKSLDRKKGGATVMSKSQTSNGSSRVRMCSKMSLSYPSPSFPRKLK